MLPPGVQFVNNAGQIMQFVTTATMSPHQGLVTHGGMPMHAPQGLVGLGGMQMHAPQGLVGPGGMPMHAPPPQGLLGTGGIPVQMQAHHGLLGAGNVPTMHGLQDLVSSACMPVHGHQGLIGSGGMAMHVPQTLGLIGPGGIPMHMSQGGTLIGPGGLTMHMPQCIMNAAQLGRSGVVGSCVTTGPGPMGPCVVNPISTSTGVGVSAAQMTLEAISPAERPASNPPSMVLPTNVSDNPLMEPIMTSAEKTGQETVILFFMF